LLVDDPAQHVDGVFADRVLGRPRAEGVAEAVAAVDEVGRAKGGYGPDGRVVAGRHGHTRCAARVQDAACVVGRGGDVDVAVHRGDSDELGIGRRCRPPDRDGVVDPTVGVDDELDRWREGHPSILTPATSAGQPRPDSAPSGSAA
jgi:hypothetical protein